MALEKLTFSKEEAAAVLGVSRFTVRRDIEMGRIQTVRYGRLHLIPRRELERISRVGMPAYQPTPTSRTTAKPKRRARKAAKG